MKKTGCKKGQTFFDKKCWPDKLPDPPKHTVIQWTQIKKLNDFEGCYIDKNSEIALCPVKNILKGTTNKMNITFKNAIQEKKQKMGIFIPNQINRKKTVSYGDKYDKKYRRHLILKVLNEIEKNILNPDERPGKKHGKDTGFDYWIEEKNPFSPLIIRGKHGLYAVGIYKPGYIPKRVEDAGGFKIQRNSIFKEAE